MINIKKPFETVVEENAAWLYCCVRERLRNPTLAEDITQEVWIKAFRGYPSYIESGQIRGWLLRIVKNTINSYYSSSKNVTVLSLDAENEEADSFYRYLQTGKSPEDEVLEKELIDEIMDVIRQLPDRQRDMMTMRFMQDMTLGQIASILHIPVGTVKSSTHYAVKTIQKEFGVQPIRKGAKHMKCQDVYKYIFKDALGVLPEKQKDDLAAHIRDCESCKKVWIALKSVVSKLTYALDDEGMHFLISFPDLKLAFCGSRHEFEDYEELNRYLDTTDRVIPEGEEFQRFSFMFNKCALLGLFDNNGTDYDYVLNELNPTHLQAHITRIPCVYPSMWQYTICSHTGMGRFAARSKEAPNLYYGHLGNSFGAAVKSALYQAIPAQATNVRIKRGNGVIDTDSYKFAYVDRYVAEDESIVLDYSYLLDM